MTLIAQVRLIAAAQWENDPGLGGISHPGLLIRSKKAFSIFGPQYWALLPREGRKPREARGFHQNALFMHPKHFQCKAQRC